MAISFVQSASVAVTSGTSGNVVLGVTPTNGNLLIGWQAIDQGAVTPTTPSGWTPLGEIFQSGGGTLRCEMFYKIASGDSATIAFGAGSAAQWVAGVCEYSPGGGTWALLVEDGEAEASANSYTTPAVDPTDGVTAITVCAAGMDADNGVTSNNRVNGSTSGVSQRINRSNATGTGATVAMWDLIEASTVAGSYTGSVDFTTTNVGCSQIAVFSAVTAASKGLPVIARHWHQVFGGG